MIPALFPDLELARVLEGAEAASSHAFCTAAAALYTGSHVRSIACAGGYGLIYGPADPLNAVKGVGLNGPVHPRDWDALESAFKQLNSPVVVDLCPLADDAFIWLLAERGYRTAAFETVTCRRLNAAEASASQSATTTHPRLSITQVDPNDHAGIAVWSHVLGVGFADGKEPFKFAVDIGRVRAYMTATAFGDTDSLMFLALVNGEPAGGASLLIHRSFRVAHFAGASVLPNFRRQGIQTALTALRIKVAAELGCLYGKFDVRAGSVSHHNAVRAGFEVAYTRPQMIKSW